DAVVVREVVEERGHRVMRGDTAKIETRRFHFQLVNLPRIAVLRQVAPGRGDTAQELQFHAAAGNFFGELDGARGVVQDLHGLDAGDVVEEPAAARVHEHGVALHLQQFEDGDDTVVRAGVLRQKALQV